MSDSTLHEAAQAYLEHLRAQGKKEPTLYTYNMDLKQMEAFFGADRKLGTIVAPLVGKFLKSDVLLKLPNEKERAKPTVDKTIRVLRMFLMWAKETGRIDKLPLPKDLPMGPSKEKQREAEADAEHNGGETAAQAV